MLFVSGRKAIRGEKEYGIPPNGRKDASPQQRGSRGQEAV